MTRMLQGRIGKGGDRDAKEAARTVPVCMRAMRMSTGCRRGALLHGVSGGDPGRRGVCQTLESDNGAGPGDQDSGAGERLKKRSSTLTAEKSSCVTANNVRSFYAQLK